MKNTYKIFIQWLGLSILLAIFWIAGMFIGNLLFPSSLMNSSDSVTPGLFALLTVTSLNAGVVLLFTYYSTARGWRLVARIALIMFGIQYFMAQIETWWFNDSLQLPLNGIFAIVSGGAVTSILFAIMTTWRTGNFNQEQFTKSDKVKIFLKPFATATALLAIVIWPAVYFLAGYYIAWQFQDVRLFYSGNTEMAPFLNMMKENFASGLYLFQIFRGVMWVLIALLVLTAIKGSWLRKGIILGLLLSVLGSSGLLLPNPYMSEAVRMAHLLETSTSNFLWGMIMAWVLEKSIAPEPSPIHNITES